MDACSRVRHSALAIVRVARDVSIARGALDVFAQKLAAQCPEPPNWDEHDVHYADDASGSGSVTAAYVMVLDTLNWCFWPSASSLEYNDLAGCLRDECRRDPDAFSAARLQSVTEADVARWFAPHDLPNLPTRVSFLHELGWMLFTQWGGEPLSLLRHARHSAVALVDLLVAALPNLRDEGVHALGGSPGSARRAFFYKRAQIMVADLWAAFGRRTCTEADAAAACRVTAPLGFPGLGGGRGGGGAGASTLSEGGTPLHPAAFYDIPSLTCFADYRIPQLLRAEGVLVYSPPLSAAVDSLSLIPVGSTQEVEIRACTVSAVDALCDVLHRTHGLRITPVELDWRLWQIGEEGATQGDKALAKSSPHHRTDTVFY